MSIVKDAIKLTTIEVQRNTATAIVKKGKEFYDAYEDKDVAFNMFADWIMETYRVHYEGDVHEKNSDTTIL